MRRVLPFLAVLSLAFAPVPFPKQATAEADLRALQGEWRLISFCHGGKPQPLYKLRYVFSGRILVATLDAGVDRWDLTLDPKARPKAMDMRMSYKGKHFLIKAVYALDGDTLTTSDDTDDWWARPTNLAGKGQHHRLRVFKRVKR